MRPTYLYQGSLKAKPGKGNQLIDILLEAAEALQSNPDCKLYAISVQEEHPDIIWVTEIWTHKEAHDVSLQDEQVRALIMRAMPLIDGQPTGGKHFQLIGRLGV